MIAIPDPLRRVPRSVLFAVAGAIHVVLIAAMVLDRASILRTGTDVLLETAPVDPRDLLRGDYVVLQYGISTIAAGALKDQPAKRRNGPIYVRLAPHPDGFHRAVSAHAEPVPVEPGEVLIQGYVTYGDQCGSGGAAYCEVIAVRYGLESYFVPEGEGLAIEQERNERKVTILAAVAPSGRAAIKRLLIEGKPVYDEPMF